VPRIKKILIANRGEIALRVIRSAKEMDIKTVAVFSDADRAAMHVISADEAVHIGPSPPAESYLCGDKIIDVCKQLGVDAIHPGYGFLSENADFAKNAANSGIIFIGPSAESIKVMGNKLAAKKAVSAYDIPLVPGTEYPVSDVDQAKAFTDKIGFPVLIKASAGGGGKGMRIVKKAEEFEDQMKRAMSEAKSAFGSDAVFIEKYITSPRHIEIQILGDQHGNVIHLNERECSIQRRYQKVIEEAPSSLLTPKLRHNMGIDAINVAKSCNYYSAGTVEFIMDKDLNYYFLEMNTRLQVEHPVTEQITGIDLVKEQIKIAEGNRLSLSQDSITIDGHSIELRIYAEDPENNFMPDVGTLQTYRRPYGPGVRVDDAYEQGMEIPIFYDPMISKLISYGKDRDEARRRMIRAIDEYRVTGIATTLGFGKFVMEHEAFIKGDFDTNFVDKHYYPENSNKKHTKKEESEIAAALSTYLLSTPSMDNPGASNKNSKNKWKLRLKEDQ